MRIKRRKRERSERGAAGVTPVSLVGRRCLVCVRANGRQEKKRDDRLSWFSSRLFPSHALTLLRCVLSYGRALLVDFFGGAFRWTEFKLAVDL